MKGRIMPKTLQRDFDHRLNINTFMVGNGIFLFTDELFSCHIFSLAALQNGAMSVGFYVVHG
jgi:hypothetical protein